MPRQKASENVSRIKVGVLDSGGNVVVDVLARGDEYVIYEVKSEDIGNRLRVYIEGFTEERDREIIERFIAVKQKYVVAKGLLYRSTNLAMMKNRVANCLASVLSSEKVDGAKEFDELIRDIKKESESLVLRHVAYVAPCMAAALVSVILAVGWVSGWFSHDLYKYIALIVISASIGGSLSLLANLKTVRFDEVGTGWYILLGVERLFLSTLASAVALILVNAKILFSDFAGKPVWSLLLVLVLAAFSEMLVPSVLQSLEKRTSTAGLPAPSTKPVPPPQNAAADKSPAGG